jgi:septum formation protein
MDKIERTILASASPRRAELIAHIFPGCEIMPAQIDEAIPPKTPPDQAVLRLAVKKAKAVFDQVGGDALVIGADTVVAVEGYLLGKPKDAAEAAGMLELLSERNHQVYTGVGVFAPGHSSSFVEATQVWVSSLDPQEIQDYIATGEPFDKAGGYGIQGPFGRYVPRIDGCYFNVVGLPVPRLYAHLKAQGLL